MDEHRIFEGDAMKVGDLVRCKKMASDIGIVMRLPNPTVAKVRYLNKGNHWTPREMLEVVNESKN